MKANQKSVHTEESLNKETCDRTEAGRGHAGYDSVLGTGSGVQWPNGLVR